MESASSVKVRLHVVLFALNARTALIISRGPSKRVATIS